MAHDLYACESLEREWCVGESVCGVADRGCHTDCDERRLYGRHDCEGASECDWGSKKKGRQSIGRSRGGLTTKIHMVTASDRGSVAFTLSLGNFHDSPEGRRLLDRVSGGVACRILMARAYGGLATRARAVSRGFIPVVPPKCDQTSPWEWDKVEYRRRSTIERYFLCLKRFRRVATRYDKLAVIYSGIIFLAMIFDAILM